MATELVNAASAGKSKKNNRARAVKTIILRVVLAIVTTLLIVLMALLAVVYVFEKGPSKSAQRIFCISCMETSALKWVPNIFLSDDEVLEIKNANAQALSNEVLSKEEPVKIPEHIGQTGASATLPQEIDPDGDGIDIFDISGSTYKGKIMVVYDPSRVFVGAIDEFSEELDGSRVITMAQKYGAVAGINGGGFKDWEGVYTGGQPAGVVISQGELRFGEPYNWYDMMGITNDNKLVCGVMSVQHALNIGVRDALFFGPTLISDGEPKNASFGGLNPRAAIGQREDGAILLLTIDGRHTNSLGASLADVRDELLKFGAVNAYNLDGGSSTTMVFNGEMINQSPFLIGYRNIPTCVLVKPQS